MGRRKVTSTLQASFLEALVLGIETEPTPTELPDDRSLAPAENPQPSIVSPAPDEITDLFGFISAMIWTTPNETLSRTLHQTCGDTVTEERVPQVGTENQNAKDSATREGELEVIAADREPSQPSSLSVASQWLLNHHPDLITRLAAIWNSMRECEGLPSLKDAQGILAPLLISSLRRSYTDAEAVEALLDCCRDLERLAQRLYGDATDQTKQQISQYVDVLMQNAIRQPYEDEEAWIRHVMDAAVRKVLAGQSNHIYSALIVSTLQRPFRDAVRQILEANEIPMPERVLALAREKGYANMMRASLQTLARLGLTAQTATLAWEAARSGQADSALPWIARRADGCAAALLDGYAIVDQRVIRYPSYALLATFDAERHVTHQMTIPITGLEEAKQSLWAQGYHHDDQGFPLPSRVVQLWCDFCQGRDNGWWLGDEAGCVRVVIPYVMRRRLGYHKPLCRAVAQMQAWGYRFRVDDHTLYFLPAGVDLPIGTQIPDKEIQTTIEA